MPTSAVRFPPGFHIVHDGQAYWPVDWYEPTDAYGVTTKRIDWRTKCPSCGAEFVITTGATWNSNPNRRCGSCKRQGASVKAERARLQNQ
jgi:hypothetical protein